MQPLKNFKDCRAPLKSSFVSKYEGLSGQNINNISQTKHQAIHDTDNHLHEDVIAPTIPE